MYALSLSIFVACLITIGIAAVRCMIFWYDRSAAKQRACLIALLAIPLLFPSLWLTAKLQRAGLPIPKPPMPDPASGECVMFVAFSFIAAYVFAFGIVRVAKGRSNT